MSKELDFQIRLSHAESENARLREALESLNKFMTGIKPDHDGAYQHGFHDAIDVIQKHIATAALKTPISDDEN